VNFAISIGRAAGLDHLGMQVETPEELREIEGRLSAAEQSVLAQKDTACCYARSDKAWVTDPQGVRWESFRTFGTADVLADESTLALAAEEKPAPSTCCGAKATA
jgi:hypothetical protein